MNIQKNLTYIKLLKKSLASTAVGPSTARRMGPTGTISAARTALQSIQLSRFSACKNERAFYLKLDRATETLKNRLPRGAKKWGSSRKFLNIFLRSCVYNKYLCKYYKLNKIEPWLEIPLDRQVAHGLKSEPGGNSLPGWDTVIRLTSIDSRAYQKFAKRIARREKINRIDLDLRYWRA